MNAPDVLRPLRIFLRACGRTNRRAFSFFLHLHLHRFVSLRALCSAHTQDSRQRVVTRQNHTGIFSLTRASSLAVYSFPSLWASFLAPRGNLGRVKANVFPDSPRWNSSTSRAAVDPGARYSQQRCDFFDRQQLLRVSRYKCI